MTPQDHARAEILSLPGWMPARSAGYCGGCDKPFRLYDPIAYDPYFNGWISVCCFNPTLPPSGSAA